MTKFEEAQKYILDRLESALDPHLYYHGLEHTKDVLGAVENIALSEGVTPHELELLKVAAAFHDAGFLVVYKNHEEAGCGIAYEYFNKIGISEEDQKIIYKLILSTKVPQKPETHLERILCDADLDYLGRDDFDFISNSLFDEFKHWNIVSDIDTWMGIQISFLEGHSYWTRFSKQYREEKKLQHLAKLKEEYPQS